MDYGEILKRAWDTIWKHKILWIFGLLASCTATHGGGGGGGGANANYSFNSGDFFNNYNYPHNFGHDFGNMDGFSYMFSGRGDEGMLILAILLGMFCLMIFLSIIFILLGSAGQIGLSRGAWWADEGDSNITFGRIWESIGKSFWRVVLLHVAYAIIGFIAALLAIGMVIMLGIMTLGIGLICIIPAAILIGIVVSILVFILIQLMIPMMVNDDVGLLDSVKKSFELIKNNFWQTVLMGIILGVIQLIIGLIIAIPLVVIIFSTIVFGVFAAGFANMGPAILIILIMAMLCFILPVAIFINAVIQAYLGSAWTITYRRLTGRVYGGVSELPIGEAPLEGEPVKVVATESKAAAAKEEKPAVEEAPKKPRRRRKKTEPEEGSKEE